MHPEGVLILIHPLGTDLKEISLWYPHHGVEDKARCMIWWLLMSVCIFFVSMLTLTVPLFLAGFVPGEDGGIISVHHANQVHDISQVHRQNQSHHHNQVHRLI